MNYKNQVLTKMLRVRELCNTAPVQILLKDINNNMNNKGLHMPKCLFIINLTRA